MAKFLIIEASARRSGSCSRLLVDAYVQALKARDASHRFVYRDLAHDPIPPLNSDTVEAIRTKPEDLSPAQRAATRLSETLIDELRAADEIVIGTPMYNWNVPAALKAWLDQVMRIGFTFGYGAGGLEGKLGGKPVLVVLARGGVYDNPQRAGLDFEKPYLDRVLRVMGLVPEFVTADGSLMGADIFDGNLASAREALERLAANH